MLERWTGGTDRAAPIWPAFAVGAAVGGIAVLLLDPRRGAIRRARIRDKAFSAIRGATAEARGRASAARRRARGRAYEQRHAHEEVSDDILVDRVRAQIGKPVSHAHAIHVEAIDGCVTLSGTILRDEVDGLLAIVRKVRGVKGVETRLRVHDRPANEPSLQG